MNALEKLMSSGLFGRMYRLPTNLDGDRAATPSAGLLSAPTQPPSQGLPSGLGSVSAGIFDDYLARSRLGGKTYKPPTMSPVGTTPTPPANTGPVMGGDNPGEGGGMGEGGGTAVGDAPSYGGVFGGDSPSPGQPGYVGTGTGTHIGGIPSGIGNSLRGAPGLIGLFGYLADLAARANPAISQFDETSVSAPGVYDSTPLDSIGLMGIADILGSESMPDIGTIGDYGGDIGIGGEGGGYGENGPGPGEGTGEGGGYAKGGKVTKKRLKGKNPPGPDDGYGALDVGELVVPAKVAKKLSKRTVAGLMGA